MIALLTVVAAAATLWAHRRARTLDDRALVRWLLLLAIAVVSEVLLLHLASAARGLRSALVPVAAITGLVTWLAISVLIAVETRRRDLLPRLLFLGAAALALAGGRWLLAAWLASFGTVAYRWRSRLETVRLFQFGVAAIALAAIASAIPPPGRLGTLADWERPFMQLARFAATVAGLHATYGGFVLFGAFVRDPSLGIRRVGWRLALSHLLVVLVPLLLVAGMWISTTVLGVSQDRAQVAARALGQESERMSLTLEAALSDPERDRAQLEAIAELHRVDWPRLRLWHRAGGALDRVAGDSLLNEAALMTWPDSLGRVPGRGLVRFGDSLFLGAAARSGSRAAVALIPVVPILDSLGRLVNASVDMIARRGLDEDPDIDLTPSQGRGEDSPEGATRSGLRRNTRLAVGADTFDTRPRSVMTLLTQGYVMIGGIAYDQDRWVRSSFLMSADNPPSRLLAGIFQLSRENPFSYLPIVLLTFVAVLFLAIAVWDIVMVTNMGRSITGAVEELRVAAEKLRNGDLGHRIDVRGKDDLWEVAGAFNLAAEGLARAREIEKEQDRIENEMQVARRIQARLLPAAAPNVPGMEIAGLYEPAREVGGDYFDHMALGDGRVLLVIADVSGKSVPAALIMSAFRTGLVSQDLARIEPDTLAERLNRLLHGSLDPGKFVTAFLGFLDGLSGKLTYVNAGHNPPVLMRRDGSHELLEHGGTILGILEDSRYERGEVTLEPGDLVALYTDGVTEGANESGQQWGDERLVEALARSDGRPCAEIARAIASAVRDFEGEQGATDDITLVLARRTT